jgi:DNA-binding CsgD family transcriptional regulator
MLVPLLRGGPRRYHRRSSDRPEARRNCKKYELRLTCGPARSRRGCLGDTRPVGDSRVEREWLELVADALRSGSATFPEQRVAEQLRRTFDARGVSFNHRTRDGAPRQRLWPLDEQFNGHRAEINSYGVHEASAAHPVLRFYLSTLQAMPLQVHDVPARFADRDVMGAWLERASGWGAPANVALPTYFAADGHRAFVIGRTDPFTPGELSLVRVLHGLLIGLDRHTAALRRLADTVDTARSAEASRLTARELTVLGLVAEGLTAAAAARRLAVSESTVHKHLQNAYRKLGVRDRLGAVLRAQQMGVLRAQDGWAADGPGA